MRAPGGRRIRTRPAFALALLVGAVLGCSPGPTFAPDATQVASVTQAPAPSPSPVPSPRPDPSASIGPQASTPPRGIEPGSVDRTSIDVSATYQVDAAISVKSGSLDVTTVLQVTNQAAFGIDRLELNTIAAKLGGIQIREATVDDGPVKVTTRDQTLLVPLGGVLPPAGQATVRITYRATLTRDLGGSDWMFTRYRGTLALYRWIPWISRAVPFDRPNHGDPFYTATSPQVDVEILTDAPMVLAAPAADVSDVRAGNGEAWSFSVKNVRDVSVLLSPDFVLTEGKVGNVKIRAYTSRFGLIGTALVRRAREAIPAMAELVGVDDPWPVLTIVETEGGEPLESPGLIWMPIRTTTRNLDYLVPHEIAHQWFYGLVGNNQQADPFADEAPADLLARTVTGLFRGSRCSRQRLDLPITKYTSGCYFEVVYVQGGLLLDDLRKRMGDKAFWGAIHAYLTGHANGFGSTKALLDTLRAATKVDLLPAIRARLPSYQPS